MATKEELAMSMCVIHGAKAGAIAGLYAESHLRRGDQESHQHWSGVHQLIIRWNHLRMGQFAPVAEDETPRTLSHQLPDRLA